MRIIVTGQMWVVLAVGVLPGATAPTAAAQDTASVTTLRGQLGASINNAGAQVSLDASRQRPLSRSRHPLLADAHVGIGGTVAFTPDRKSTRLNSSHQ